MAEGEFRLRSYLLSASTADRKKSWTVWKKEQISCGASKLYIDDVNDEFCDEYIVPCVQAHAVYENKYLLGTSMARPLIAKKLVEVARKEGATAICHGATGKGNDQIRFELGIKALAPDLKIIAAMEKR